MEAPLVTTDADRHVQEALPAVRARLTRLRKRLAQFEQDHAGWVQEPAWHRLHREYLAAASEYADMVGW